MKRILFLQSPLGTFFKQAAQYFHSQHHKTYKINFNGGDKHYGWASQTDDYTGTLEQWSTYLIEYINKYNISIIVVFGDCRFYHAEAAKIAKKLGVSFCVCEEGYLRAGFITLEEGGCNANSSLDLSHKAITAANTKPIISDQQVGRTFLQRCISAIHYYYERRQATNTFPYYQHHRPLGEWQEAGFWLCNFKQKFISELLDPVALTSFKKKYHKQYFLLPLQVETDFQMRKHSRFNSVKESIQFTLKSFAKHANKDDALLIKHHPQSRGFVHYGKFIKALSKEFSITERILYVHQANLPSIYHSCKGVVTVNSTVGLSAVLHYLPTITLGKAIYDVPELTFQGTLSDFWQNDFNVNEELLTLFQGYLQAKTQIQGDFYKPSKEFLARFYQRVMMNSTLLRDKKKSTPNSVTNIEKKQPILEPLKQKCG